MIALEIDNSLNRLTIRETKGDDKMKQKNSCELSEEDYLKALIQKTSETNVLLEKILINISLPSDQEEAAKTLHYNKKYIEDLKRTNDYQWHEISRLRKIISGNYS